MKFLCLPGAYGSVKNFKVQLGPFADEIERRALATLSYTEGQHQVDAPPEFQNYFGMPPLYRFIDPFSGCDRFEPLSHIRRLPRGLSAEETVRLLNDSVVDEVQPWQKDLDFVRRIIDTDPSIDGLIGYSEGALVGSSLVLQEEQRWKSGRTPRRIKFAIFFAGAPPEDMISNPKLALPQLVDQVGVVINIPTLHVFGCNDPHVYSAVALYNVCNPTTAVMYDHGQGHLVPRDAENIKELGAVLEKMLEDVAEDGGEEVAERKDI